MSQVIPTAHNQKPSVRALQGNLNDIKATPTTNGTSAASPISNWLWSGRELAQLETQGQTWPLLSQLWCLSVWHHIVVQEEASFPPARLSLGEKQPGLQKVP